jgi:phage gp45-like
MQVFKVVVSEITASDRHSLVDAIGRAGEEIIQRPSYQHAGFHSTLKPGTVGFMIANGENITMIASADTSEDRPDDLDNSTAIYRDADKYVKIADNGDITVANDQNKIILKSNGDIELGEGTLKKLVTEDILSVLTSHTHTCGSPGGPTTATIFTPPLSAALHCTSKVSGI